MWVAATRGNAGVGGSRRGGWTCGRVAGVRWAQRSSDAGRAPAMPRTIQALTSSSIRPLKRLLHHLFAHLAIYSLISPSVRVRVAGVRWARRTSYAGRVPAIHQPSEEEKIFFFNRFDFYHNSLNSPLLLTSTEVPPFL